MSDRWQTILAENWDIITANRVVAGAEMESIT